MEHDMKGGKKERKYFVHWNREKEKHIRQNEQTCPGETFVHVQNKQTRCHEVEIRMGRQMSK